MDPFTVFMFVAGGAQVAKGILEYNAAQDKTRAIELEAAQQPNSITATSITNYRFDSTNHSETRSRISHARC